MYEFYHMYMYLLAPPLLSTAVRVHEGRTPYVLHVPAAAPIRCITYDSSCARATGALLAHAEAIAAQRSAWILPIPIERNT